MKLKLKMQILKYWYLWITLIVSTSCVSRLQEAPQCMSGIVPMTRETIYFGRNIPGGSRVENSDWQQFLSDVMSVRFPQGLTIVDASGRWRGANNKVEDEQSQIVTIYHDGSEASQYKIAEIVTDYKMRFKQEAVLRESAVVCAVFQ